MGSLALLAHAWQQLAAESARSAKIDALAQCLTRIDPAEIELAVHYLAGQLPQGKLGVAYASLQAVAQVPAAPLARLSLSDVDQRFTALADVRGAGAAARRRELLRELWAEADALEQQFLLRLLIGELRAGALSAMVLEGIAAAAGIAPELVRRAAMYADSLGAVARSALQQGPDALAAFQLRTLYPLEPMLAQTTTDVAGALERLGGEAAFEWKIDGARIQLHKRAAEVRIFTRRLNDVSAALPEIVELAHALPADELVLDGEVVVLDAAGRPRPFQVTMRRFGRKLDIAQLRARLPLHAYFFDCLRLQAQTLVERPARARFEALARAVPAEYCVTRLISADVACAERFYLQALAAGHEGIMAKALDSPYEAGNRGASWLKIKRAHTLDLVVLAAEWGHGRRSGWLSNLHLGAREEQGAEPVMLGKTFKGLTDALLQWQTRELLARERCRDAMTVYVRPELVVEVAFNDIQASSQYAGGLALRFARVKRYRNDKTADEADSIATVRRLYQTQSGAV